MRPEKLQAVCEGRMGVMSEDGVPASIWLADVAMFSDRVMFEEGLAQITEERRAQIARLKSSADQRRSLGAGLLLEFGLRARGYSLLEGVCNKTKINIERGEYGKPYVRELPELGFNLSHAGNYVAAVFSEGAAGIDIECRRKVRDGMAKRFFSEGEYAAFLRGEHDFFWFWTRKESYIKAVGEGMHLPLTDFSTLSDEMAGERRYYFKTWEMGEGLFLSVCDEKPVAAEPVWVDLARIFDGVRGSHYDDSL